MKMFIKLNILMENAEFGHMDQCVKKAPSLVLKKTFINSLMECEFVWSRGSWMVRGWRRCSGVEKLVRRFSALVPCIRESKKGYFHSIPPTWSPVWVQPWENVLLAARKMMRWKRTSHTPFMQFFPLWFLGNHHSLQSLQRRISHAQSMWQSYLKSRDVRKFINLWLCLRTRKHVLILCHSWSHFGLFKAWPISNMVLPALLKFLLLTW